MLNLLFAPFLDALTLLLWRRSIGDFKYSVSLSWLDSFSSSSRTRGVGRTTEIFYCPPPVAALLVCFFFIFKLLDCFAFCLRASLRGDFFFVEAVIKLRSVPYLFTYTRGLGDSLLGRIASKAAGRITCKESPSDTVLSVPAFICCYYHKC